MLACLPFLAVDFVPATDLPQHVAQVRMLQEAWGLAEPTIDLSQAEVRLLGGNTLVYYPMLLLALVVSPILAGKLTVLLLVMASVVALHWLARRRSADPTHALVAGMLVFNVAFYWGFLNFISGLPLFLFLLGYAGLPEEEFDRRTFAVCAGLTLLLFWAHVLWLPAAALAVAVMHVVARGSFLGLVCKGLAFLPAVAMAGIWLPDLVEARQSGGFDMGAVYQGSVLRRLTPAWWVDAAFGGIAGAFEKIALAGLVAVGAAGWLVARRAGRPGADRALLAAGGAFLLFALLAPDKYANTIFLNSRFLSVAGMLLLIGLPCVRSRAVAVAAAVLAVGFSLGTSVAWSLYDQDDLSGLRASLASVEGPRSVLGLSLRKHSTVLRGRPFIQTFAYFQAVHGGENNFSFAEHASSIVAYVGPRDISWHIGLEWYPERVGREDIEAFDCVLLNDSEQGHAFFAEQTGMRSAVTEGYFRIYCRE